VATFRVYCPCKVKELGVQIVTGDFAYIIWTSKEDREKKNGKFTICQHCGNPLVYVGEDKVVE